MAFEGCHCGKLAYTVDEDPPAKAMACNCSICRRRGALHHFTTPDKFHFRGSEADVATYRWNKQIIRFEFCTTCGCALRPRHRPQRSDGRDQPALRQGIDLDKLEISAFDGAHKLPRSRRSGAAKA